MERLIEQYESNLAGSRKVDGAKAESPKSPPEATQPRRSMPRQPVDWMGRYRLQGDPAGYWRACRIADISTAGAGLRLFGVKREEVEGRTIDLSVQLSGDVRNIVDGTDNDLRVGIEFADLMGDSVNYVESLKRSATRW